MRHSVDIQFGSPLVAGLQCTNELRHSLGLANDKQHFRGVDNSSTKPKLQAGIAYSQDKPLHDPGLETSESGYPDLRA